VIAVARQASRQVVECRETRVLLRAAPSRIIETMTAEQILDEIRALSAGERERLAQRMRQLAEDEIPQDFIEALEDFEKGRFVPMETALNESPPGG
jgi:hypothetical protein